MVQLGPADMATLDALITSGITVSRSAGARWVLARVREQSAYAELSGRPREASGLVGQGGRPSPAVAEARCSVAQVKPGREQLAATRSTNRPQKQDPKVNRWWGGSTRTQDRRYPPLRRG